VSWEVGWRSFGKLLGGSLGGCWGRAAQGAKGRLSHKSQYISALEVCVCVLTLRVCFEEGVTLHRFLQPEMLRGRKVAPAKESWALCRCRQNPCSQKLFQEKCSDVTPSPWVSCCTHFHYSPSHEPGIYSGLLPWHNRFRIVYNHIHYSNHIPRNFPDMPDVGSTRCPGSVNPILHEIQRTCEEGEVRWTLLDRSNKVTRCM